MNRKIFYIFFTLIFLMLLCGSKSFATITYSNTMGLQVDGINYRIPWAFEDYTYSDYLVVTSDIANENEATEKKRAFYVFFYDADKADFVYSENVTKSVQLYKKNSNDQYSPNYIKAYYCFDLDGVNASKGDMISHNYFSVNRASDLKIIYSSAGVYNEKSVSKPGANYDSVFFQKTPVCKTPTNLEEAIAGMSAEEVPATIAKMIAIVAFLVVSLMGLRKCLSLLKAQLEQT